MNMTIKERMELTTGDGMWHTRDLNGKLSRLHLSDGPHGLRKQEDGQTNNDSILATCFPTASALAASWDPELASRVAEAIAKEAYNENVSILLGPGINMKRSPLCGRNFEYYSEDPYLAGAFGTAFVKAVEKEGIGTSLKHFAANSQETKRMTSNSMVDVRALREIYLRAFETVVKDAKPATLMASYNKINGLYATENHWLLTDVLRQEWGYQGAVISDWGACLRLTDALKAGMDLEMPDSHGFHLKKLKKNYQKGMITDEEICSPSNRILHLIEKYDSSKRVGKKDISRNHEIAIEAASESAVLLENDGILPLKRQKIVVIGGLAKEVRFQGGGSSHIHTESVKDAIEALTEIGYEVAYYQGYRCESNQVDSVLEEEALNRVSSDSILLFFGGLTDITEGEGYDRTTLDMPMNQQVLLEKLSKKNQNIVFISFGGAPYNIYFERECRAILHMYLGGEGVMEAMARLVAGEVNPSGKLAETFPLQVEDTPCYGNFATGSKDIPYKESIFIGYRYYDTFKVPVRYPFGYGKSYTSFAYSDLQIEENKVSFKIKNIGKIKGKEIAEIYARRLTEDYMHPDKELVGFLKVELNPMEEKKVSIHLSKEVFQIYDETQGWILPKGKVEILVGQSVEDILLSKKIEMDGISYHKDVPAVYNNKEAKLKNITDEDFLALYKKELSHLDQVGKGDYSIESSLAELSKHSLKAKLLLAIAKKIIYKEFKNKPQDDPEVKMIIETLEGGSIDCVCCQGGIPYRIAESIVCSANGHRFKALHKLIWG